MEALIHSTGFFRAKARNLVALAARIVERHGGEVPRDLDALTDLPGVGRKTAHVVLGNAFGIASGVVVDTHVKRLAYRLGLTTSRDPVVIERELCGLVPRAGWIDLSHRLIEHGRRTCLALRPRCERCALEPLCPKRGVAPSPMRPGNASARVRFRQAGDRVILNVATHDPHGLKFRAREAPAMHIHDIFRRTRPRSASSSSRRRPTRRPRSCSAPSPSCRRCSRRSSRSPTAPAARPASGRTTWSSASSARPNLTAVSHLTCVCHTRGRAGGDPRPLRRVGHREHPGPRRRPAPRPGRLRPRAATPSATPSELVAFIQRAANAPDPRGFGIGVAGFPEGHPGTPNRLKEMDYLKRKVDAGADYICTQLFFDNRDFYDFRERCDLAGIKVPIVAGIMPITSQGRA